nr:unnamed protein product [Callosobruchus analis]
MNKHFSEVPQKLMQQIKYIKHHCNIPVNKHSITLEPITPNKLIEIAKRLKNKYSSGADEIPTSIIKEFFKEIQDILCYTINNSFKYGIFPEQLKLSKIIPIFKKGEPNLLENYRPISILNSFSKLLEHSFCLQLIDFFNNLKLFSDIQTTWIPERLIGYFSTIPINTTYNSAMPQTDVNPIHYLQDINPLNMEFKFREIFNEVRDIIDQLSNKKVLIYGLTVPLIKSVKNLIIVPITKLINSCIRCSIFPRGLKRALVTPIFKKGDKHQVSNFRPISLLPIISKIFERALSLQIVNFFETHNLFTSKQFGFRKDRNTTLAMLDLLAAIYDSYENCQLLYALFCDLSKAFDCVNIAYF